VLRAYRRLPPVTVAADEEVLRFIDLQALFGRGIGYVDAHLLAATRLTPGAKLWTHDRRLHAVAAKPALAAS
jgi:predicted nucleic acid-binding protein